MMEKKYNYPLHTAFMLLALTLFCLSCKKMDGYNDPVSADMTKPGVVTNIKVDNFNGGAHITYSLPNTENLLYVMAQYKINDKTSRQTKSSYYSDTITVEGFAKSQDYEVTLYCVSRANVMSEPVTVKVHPDTPPYLLIKPTVELNADFGGINVKAENPLGSAVGMILVALDSTTNGFEVEDQHYTNTKSVNYSVRGYTTVPRKFGLYITDKFGNVSDTTITTLTPLFETQLDKNKFFVYRLPSDSPIGYGWDLPYLWDGKTDGYSNGWHTNPGAPAPMVATFGLGQPAKISRFVLYNRPNEFSYSHGNAKDFIMWGSSKSAPQDVTLPRSAPAGTVVGDWISLGTFHFPDPPSGLPASAVNDADRKFVAAGVNFNMSDATIVVRYIRFHVLNTWSGGDFAHAMELTFYGQPQ